MCCSQSVLYTCTFYHSSYILKFIMINYISQKVLVTSSNQRLYMEMRSKVSGGSEPLKKAKGAIFRSPGHQKFSNFSSCKAQGNQHKIRITFLKRDNNDDDEL